jgi:hypothetical protein
MANIWLVKEGPETTSGDEPFRKMPLPACVKQLGLIENNYLCGLDQPPSFPKEESRPGIVRGPRAVVVEIDETEARAHGWEPGFYGSSLTVNEALKRLSTQ